MKRASAHGEPSLESRLRRIAMLMYDTGISLEQLEREVVPYFDRGIVFKDPVLSGRGFPIVRIGLRGFHCAFEFHLDIHQMTVDEENRRALFDTTMHLGSIPGYSYPLRTMLVYRFHLDEGDLRITEIEEIWSLGDMIANAPLGLGLLYNRVFRPISGVAFMTFFWLTTVLRGGRVRKSRSSPALA